MEISGNLKKSQEISWKFGLSGQLISIFGSKKAPFFSIVDSWEGRWSMSRPVNGTGSGFFQLIWIEKQGSNQYKTGIQH